MKIKSTTGLVSVFLLLIVALSSCKKETATKATIPEKNLTDKEKLSMQIFGNTEFRFNKNDSNYLNSIKRLSEKFNSKLRKGNPDNNSITACNLNGTDSTFGWYTDPDTVILAGPYVIAKTPTYESVAENCSDLIACAAEANQYLINEGYSDIAHTYYTVLRPGLRFHVIHAANALIELKENFILEEVSRNSGNQVQQKIIQCILEAIGGATAAELASNWASMSRTQIIKAVGKLAAKHLNWVGAAVAIITFIDCMWG
jgi:hypothetical protein